jgi:copper chaperone
MQTTIYAVEGMTCAHCVSAVSSEIGQISGVTDVQVNLATGTVTVVSDSTPDDDAIRAAVEEAGYEVGTSA